MGILDLLKTLSPTRDMTSSTRPCGSNERIARGHCHVWLTALNRRLFGFGLLLEVGRLHLEQFALGGAFLAVAQAGEHVALCRHPVALLGAIVGETSTVAALQDLKIKQITVQYCLMYNSVLIGTFNPQRALAKAGNL